MSDEELYAISSDLDIVNEDDVWSEMERDLSEDEIDPDYMDEDE